MGVVLLIDPDSVKAQFRIDATDPASGTVGVSLSETIAFGFNEAIDLSTDWNTAFLPEPRDALSIGDVLICLNLTGSCGGGGGSARYVRFEMQHEPNTDYVWIVDAVQSSSGESMTEPFVLNYTTQSTIGQRQVSGMVSEGTAKSTRSLSPQHRASLRQAVEMINQSGLGQPVFEATPPPSPGMELVQDALMKSSHARSESKAAKSSHSYDYTRIYLVEEFSIDQGGWAVRGADVINGTSGNYTVEYMRDGTYWPLAVRYTDGSNSQISAVGYHDANADGEPDAIIIDGSDEPNIDITLYEFPLTTAQENLSEAQGIAEDVAPDQELITIKAGTGKRPEGNAYSWTYQFFSPSRYKETVVTVDPLGAEVESGPAPAYLTRMASVPGSFIDSDEALQIMLTNGGKQLIDEYNPDDLTTTIEAGDLYWLVDPDDLNIVFWRVRITALTSSGSEQVERFIDAQTGEVLDPTALPVELTSFTAQAADASSILLRWETASETNNAGFDVEHQVPGTSAFEPVAFVGGQGTTSRPHQYRHRVEGVTAGTHRFRLRQVDTDGTSTYSPEVEVQVMLDRPLVFEPPYPNPVRSRATVRFGTRDGGLVRMELYDALGRRVRTLHSGEATSGDMHTHHVEVSGLSSGLYFLRLIGPSGETEVRSMTVVQ